MAVVKRRVFFIVIVFFLIFGVYLRGINSAGFIFDDKSYIKKAPIFNSDVSLIDVLKTGFDGGQFINHKDSMYYRPFVTLSFYMEKKLIGFSAKSLHFTNVLLYFLALVFVYLFLLRQDLKPFSAELMVLLFSLVPINVDNVVWIVGRYDIFLLLFGFLSLYLLDLGIEKGKNLYYVFSSLFFVLGMFSKETFIIWGVFFIIYEFLKRRKIKFYYHLTNIVTVFIFFLIKNIILGFGSLSFYFDKNFFHSFKLLFLTVSVYFKTLIFPVLIPKFYFVETIPAKNLIFGIFFIIFIIIFMMKSIKSKNFLIPFSLFVLSFLPYLYLIFTNLWPFRISTRYMMIPYLSFLWLVFLLIDKVSFKLKSTLTLLFLVLFVYSDLISIKTYSSELDYWKNAYYYYPENSYVLYSLADSFYNKEDLLSSEFYLKKALKYPLKKMTAYYVSLLFAYIEMKKADYEKSLTWIKNTEKLENMFYVPIYEKVKKLFFWADYYTYKGQVKKAEDSLIKAKKLIPFKILIYEKLYNLYSGYELWSRAIKVEKEIKDKFPFYRKLDTEKRMERFRLYNDKQKILFYIFNKNYRGAIKIIVKKRERTKADDLFLLESYLRLEDLMNYKKSVEEFIHKWGNNYQTFKELGYFFIKRLYRIKEANSFFEKSLNMNPNQPTLKAFLKYLRSLGLD